MGVFRKRISSQDWCKCFVTFLQKRTKGYKIFSRIITIFSCRCNQHTNMMKVCKKTPLNMTECCMTAKKARKKAIHILKYIFRDTTQRKENAFYTALPGEKNNTGREKFCSPGGAVLRTWSAAALYLYSDRADETQPTFLWELPEIRATVFCVLNQPGKQN